MSNDAALTPETLRTQVTARGALCRFTGSPWLVLDCADAWAADKARYLAEAKRNMEGWTNCVMEIADLRKRLEAAERAMEHALSDLEFVEREGPPGTNMQSSILHLEAALAAQEKPHA